MSREVSSTAWRFYTEAGYCTRVTPGEPRNLRVALSRRF